MAEIHWFDFTSIISELTEEDKTKFYSMVRYKINACS